MYIGEYIDRVARRKIKNKNKIREQPDYETYKKKLTA